MAAAGGAVAAPSVVHSLAELVTRIRSAAQFDDPQQYGASVVDTWLRVEIPGLLTTLAHLDTSMRRDGVVALRLGDCALWEWSYQDNTSEIPDILLNQSDVTACPFFDITQPTVTKGYGTKVLNFFDQLNQAIGVRACFLYDASHLTLCGCHSVSYAFLKRLTTGRSWYNSFAFLELDTSDEGKGHHREPHDVRKVVAAFNKRFVATQALLRQTPASHVQQWLQSVKVDAERKYAESTSRFPPANYQTWQVSQQRLVAVNRSIQDAQPFLGQAHTMHDFFMQVVQAATSQNEPTACRLVEALLTEDAFPFVGQLKRLWPSDRALVKFYQNENGLPLKWYFTTNPDTGLARLEARVRRPSLVVQPSR